jgi:hypothetical protein
LEQVELVLVEHQTKMEHKVLHQFFHLLHQQVAELEQW